MHITLALIKSIKTAGLSLGSGLFAVAIVFKKRVVRVANDGILCVEGGAVVLVKVIGCSSLRGGGGELGTNKNLDLWLQLVCTKLKLKHAI